MGSNLPGQSLRKCGHASHVDSCGSHSAGMRYPSAAGRSLARVADSLAIFRSPSLSVNHATGDGSVTVDAAVAQEGPVAANLLQLMQVYFAEQNFFLIVRSFGQHAPEGIAEERPSPEFEAFAGRGIAANVASLEADAIHHANINAVCDGVRPLDGAPGVVLRLAEFRLLRGMPSDGRGVKQNAGSLECGKARAFRIPLIPADERAEFSGGGVESLEAEIARSEIKLFGFAGEVPGIGGVGGGEGDGLEFFNFEEVVVQPGFGVDLDGLQRVGNQEEVFGVIGEDEVAAIGKLAAAQRGGAGGLFGG